MADDQELSDVVQKEGQAMEERKPGLLSYLLHTGLAAGSTALSYSLVGFGGPLTGIGFGVGSLLLSAMGKSEEEKSKGLLGAIRDYSIGALMGILGVGMWNAAAEYIPNPWTRGILGGTVGNAIWSTAYIGTDHLYKHGPEGLGEAYNNKWTKLTSNTILWMGIPVGLTMNGYLGGYPGIVAVDVGFRTLAGLTSGKKSAGAHSGYQPQSPYPTPDYQPA